jgi:tRNA(Ile2) C34 agmatinyltransferase TiaS
MRREFFTFAAAGYWLLGTILAASGVVSNLTSDAGEAAGAVLLYVTLWGACTAIAVAATVYIHRVHRDNERTHLGLCPQCGNDLRGTPDRCPECGTAAAEKVAGA